MLLFSVGQAKTPKDAQKQVRFLYTKDFDLRSDAEKQAAGLHIWTDEGHIAKDPALAVLSKDYKGVKTHENVEGALRACNVDLWNHDFMSMQDTVCGYVIKKNQRYRLFTQGHGFNVFRIEISEEVLNLRFDPTMFGNPKL